MENKTKRIIHVMLLCGIILQSCTLPQAAKALDAGDIAKKAVNAASWVGTSWQASPFWFTVKAATAGTLAYMLWKERKTIPQAYYWCKTKNSRATNVALAGLATAGSLVMFMKFFGPYMKNQRALGYAIELMTPVLTGLMMAMAGHEDKEGGADIANSKGKVYKALEDKYHSSDPETVLGSVVKQGAETLGNFFSFTMKNPKTLPKTPTRTDLYNMNPECRDYIEKLERGMVCPLLQTGGTGTGKTFFVELLYQYLRSQGQNIALVSLNTANLANTQGLKDVGSNALGSILQEALRAYVRCGYLPIGSIVFFDEADLTIARFDHTAHGPVDPSNKDAGNNNDLNKTFMENLEIITTELGLRLITASNLTEAEIAGPIISRFKREIDGQEDSSGNVINKPIPTPEVRRAIFKYIFRDDPRFVQDIEEKDMQGNEKVEGGKALLDKLVDATDNFSPTHIKTLCTELVRKWASKRKGKHYIPFGTNNKKYGGDYDIILQEALLASVREAIGNLEERKQKKCDTIRETEVGKEAYEKKGKEEKVLTDLDVRQKNEIRNLQSRIDKLECTAYNLALKAQQAQLNQEIVGLKQQSSSEPRKQRWAEEAKNKLKTTFFAPESEDSCTKYWKDRKKKHKTELRLATIQKSNDENKKDALLTEREQALDDIEKIRQLIDQTNNFNRDFQHLEGSQQINPVTVATGLDERLKELPHVLKELQKSGFKSFAYIARNANPNQPKDTRILMLKGAISKLNDQHKKLTRNIQSILPQKIEGIEEDGIDRYNEKTLEAIQNDLEKATEELQRREREYQRLLEKIDMLAAENPLPEEDTTLKVRRDLRKDPTIVSIDLYKDEAAAYKEEIKGKFFNSEFANNKLVRMAICRVLKPLDPESVLELLPRKLAGNITTTEQYSIFSDTIAKNIDSRSLYNFINRKIDKFTKEKKQLAGILKTKIRNPNDPVDKETERLQKVETTLASLKSLNSKLGDKLPPVRTLDSFLNTAHTSL